MNNKIILTKKHNAPAYNQPLLHIYFGAVTEKLNTKVHKKGNITNTFLLCVVLSKGEREKKQSIGKG